VGKLLEISRVAQREETLDREQWAAVRHGDGPLLVVAGAGTGKTRVITERIRYLLETQPELAGESILGLTFTEKAAAEMKQRVLAGVGERGKQVWLGTFHSFCRNVLLEVNPSLEILDETDHWIFLRRNLGQLRLDHYKRLADPGRFLSDFVQFFSRCQDELVTPDDYQRYADGLRAGYAREKAMLDPAARSDREAEIARQQEIARAYRVSEGLLRERNLYTYGALLLETVQQLRAKPTLLRRLQQRYRYILVDEFQDTNIAQIELLRLLAGRNGNIVAVGDDDQAIYRFRGASFGSFQLFAEHFIGAKGSPGKTETPIVMLRQNYRSTRRILRAAGQVISQNKDRYAAEKRLFTANGAGEKVRIVELAQPEDEARWIVEELERFHGAGRRWNEFAVLYRAHAHRNFLVEMVSQQRIPYVIRKLSILDSTLVRDMMAYLRLVVTPSDNVACARVLAAPYWGLEPADVVRLVERASKSRGLALWDVLQDAQAELSFAKDHKRTGELAAWITALRERAKHLTAAAMLEELLTSLELALLPADPDRRALDRFIEFVREWEKKSQTKTLREFVEYLGYFQEAGGEICLEEEPTENAVQLMTVHAAKGLEFDHVFVMRLARGAFPTWPRRPVLEFPAELMKEEKPQGDFHVQEERRLFYVALTRARQGLTLTSVVGARSKPSAFLDDILMDPQIQHADVLQLAPALEPAPAQPGLRQLFDPARRNLRAYSRIALWSLDYRPPVLEPLQLSASAIDTYQTCPLKYLFQQVWGLRGGPQAALTFGNVMHTTIAQFVRELRKRGHLLFDEVEAIYRREWSAAGFRDAYQEEEYQKAGLEQLREFHRSYTQAPPEVLHQEKYFELALASNVVVIGRMDQINRVGPRSVEIVDYKTGRPRLEKDAQKSLQLSLYAMATREVLELDPVRLVFYNLNGNAAVATTREEKALEEARQTVEEVADQIRARDFSPKPGYACRACDFQPICPAHEQIVSIRPER